MQIADPLLQLPKNQRSVDSHRYIREDWIFSRSFLLDFTDRMTYYMINDGSSASRATTTAAAASFPMPWMVSVHLRPSPFLYDGLFCPFGGLLIVRPGLSGAILHWSGLVHFASRLWPPRHPMPDNLGTVLGGYVSTLCKCKVHAITFISYRI